MIDAEIQIDNYTLRFGEGDESPHIEVKRNDFQDDHDHWHGPIRHVVLNELFKDEPVWRKGE